MRLIDADALKDYKCSVCENRERCEDREQVCSDIAEIDEQPTIEAEPVKHGRWVKHRIEKYDNYGNYTNAPGLTDCSNCNFAAYGIAEIYNFCPQCGVRMDGDDNA